MSRWMRGIPKRRQLKRSEYPDSRQKKEEATVGEVVSDYEYPYELR